MLEAAVTALGNFQSRFVFLGGSTTGLLVTDPAAASVRATLDVDVVVEVMTLVDYHELERELEHAKFTHDRSADAPICRWIVGGCRVDIMPTDEKILGFGNRWFVPAIETAQLTRLPRGQTIRIATAPMFLATKLEAFKARGNGDFVASHDLEDIIAVIDGRPSLLSEVKSAPEAVRTYTAQEIAALLRSSRFLEALYGHVTGDQASQARVPLIRERLRQLSET